MAEDSKRDDFFQNELARLRMLEERKRVLLDRSIGGENAPRPSPDYIKECVGRLKTDSELQNEAGERAEREQRRAREEAQRRAELEQSLREHSCEIEKRKKYADRLNQAFREGRKADTERER